MTVSSLKCTHAVLIWPLKIEEFQMNQSNFFYQPDTHHDPSATELLYINHFILHRTHLKEA
jgi:hypothetical protein